tara:strand:- start:399 stop:854 length:456 start_codon:yes stop_codon:yes gene_type:complete
MNIFEAIEHIDGHIVLETADQVAAALILTELRRMTNSAPSTHNETDVDDTNVVDISREAFERAFPIPKEANYVVGLNPYGAGVYTEPSMTRYNSKWEGWQACEQSKQAEIDGLRAELEKAKELLEIATCPDCGFKECTWCNEVAQLIGETV